MKTPRKRFRVALSFAGEKRSYVANVAELLSQRFGRTAILYDKYHEAEFARRDLGVYLPELYHRESDLIVVVICPNYSAKEWCGLEWDAIFDLLKQRKDEDVMLCRFEYATVRGLFSTAGFLDLDSRPAEDTKIRILERLALNEGRARIYYCGSPAEVDHDAAPPTVEDSAEAIFEAFEKDQVHEDHTPGLFKAASIVGGRYQTLRLLAYGTRGEVYQAFDLALKAMIALKALRSVMQLGQRFRSEIILSRTVTHPNICRMFDLGVDTSLGQPVTYATMEYVEGPSLAERIEPGLPLERRLVLYVATCLAGALDAGHTNGIIHGRLNPRNVLLTSHHSGPFGLRPVITNFGVPEEFSIGMTDSSPSSVYLAPEQLAGKGGSPASDVFSLGLIIFEMITGKSYCMNTGTGGVPLQHNRTPSLAEAGCPRDWVRALERALATDPTKRYKSAVELVKDLDRENRKPRWFYS